MERIEQLEYLNENDAMASLTIKTQKPILKLLSGLSLLILGITFIFIETAVTQLIILGLFFLLIIAIGIWRCIADINDDKIATGIIVISISFIAASTIWIYNDFFLSFLNIFLAVLAFVIALLRILIIIHLATVEGPGIFSNVVSALMCITFGILMLIFDFYDASGLLSLVCGVYLIFYGITFIGDFFASITKSDLKRDRVKRRSHFALPNFITAYQSTGIVKKYNKILKNNPELTKLITYKSDSKDRDVNFDILIHVSQIMAKRMGHVDIAIGNTVYTYGCYDSSYNKLGGMISKGTFCVLPKEPYLQNCLSQQRKYVIDYGCHMSEEQMTAINNRIDEIFTHTTKIELNYDPASDIEGNDGANTVAKLGGELYHVNDGPFKTYFAISSNCVQLADTIIGTTGFDTLSRNSLKTPGAYYRMMENMFKRKGTRVVRKTVYLQNEKGEKEMLEKKAKERAAEKKKKKSEKNTVS